MLLLLNAANINLLKPTIYPTQGDHANITELMRLKEKTFLCVKKKRESYLKARSIIQAQIILLLFLVYELLSIIFVFVSRVMVFNATFNDISVYIVVVNFIGGGNQSTRRKPPTCRKSLTSFIIVLYGVHLTTLVVIGTDCTRP